MRRAAVAFAAGSPVLISYLIVTNWTELIRHGDVVDAYGVSSIGGLTCVFWAENGKNNFWGVFLANESGIYKGALRVRGSVIRENSEQHGTRGASGGSKAPSRRCE
jgi:hypothetical protein